MGSFFSFLTWAFSVLLSIEIIPGYVSMGTLMIFGFISFAFSVFFKAVFGGGNQ